MENNNWWTRRKNRPAREDLTRPQRPEMPDIGADYLKQERQTFMARRALNAGQANQSVQQAGSTGTTETDFIRQQAEVISRVSEYKANPTAFRTKYGNEQAQVMDTIAKQLEINGFNVSQTPDKQLPTMAMPREYLSEKDLPQDVISRGQREMVKTIWGLNAEETQKAADDFAKDYLPAPDARFLGFPIGRATRATTASILGLGEPTRPDLLLPTAAPRAMGEAMGIDFDPTKAVQLKDGVVSINPSLAVGFKDSSWVKQWVEGKTGLTGENADVLYQGAADTIISAALPISRDPVVREWIFPVLNSVTTILKGAVGAVQRVLPTSKGKVNKALDVVYLSDAAEALRDPQGKAEEISREISEAKEIVAFGPNEEKTMYEYFDIAREFDPQGNWSREYERKMGERYGILGGFIFNDPRNVAMANAAFIPFSSPEDRLNAVLRVYAGEDPDVVLQGAVITKVAFGDEIELFAKRVQEHIAAAGRVAMMKARYANPYISPDDLEKIRISGEQEASERFNADGFIRGEADPIAEMAGDMVLSAVSAKVTFGGVSTALSKVPGVGKYIAKVIPPPTQEAVIANATKAIGLPLRDRIRLAVKAGDIPIDPLQRVNLSDLLGRRSNVDPQAQSLSHVRKLAGKYDPNNEEHVQQVESILSGLSVSYMKAQAKVLDIAADKSRSGVVRALASAVAFGFDKISYTNAASAHIATGYALEIVDEITRDAMTPEVAQMRISQFLVSPDALPPRFRSLANSLKAAIAKKALKQVDIASLVDGKTRIEQMLNAEKVISANAKEQFGVKPLKDRSAFEKFVFGFKRWSSELWLRNMGYVIRNAFSDNAMIAIDGWSILENTKMMNEHLAGYGIVPQALVGERGGFSSETPEKTESVFKDIPVLKNIIAPINNKIQDLNDAWEEGRRVKVFGQAFRMFIKKMWNPMLDQNVERLMGESFKAKWRVLNDRLLFARNSAEIQKAFDDILQIKTPYHAWVIEDTFKKYGIDARVLEASTIKLLQAKLEEAEMRGATEAEVEAIFQEMIDDLERERGKTLRNVGVILDSSEKFNPLEGAASNLEMYANALNSYVELLIRNGMDEATARAQGNELITKIKEDEQSVVNARARSGMSLADALRSLGKVPDADFLMKIGQIMSWSMDQEAAIRGNTREKVDALDRATWERTDGQRTIESRDDWDKYRRESSQIWTENNRQIMAIHERAAKMMEEFAVSYIKGEHTVWWTEMLKKSPEMENSLFGGLVDAEYYKLMTRISTEAEREEFFALLNTNRAKNDESRRALYQMAYIWLKHDPHAVVDVFAVIRNAENRIIESAGTIIAEKRRLLFRKDNKEITLEEYMKIVDGLWKSHYKFVDSILSKYAPAKIVWGQVQNSPIAVLLRKAGKTDKQIFDLLADLVNTGSHDDTVKVIHAAIGEFSPEDISKFLVAAEVERARHLYGVDVAAAVADGTMTFSDASATVNLPNRERIVKYLRAQFSGLGTSEFNAALAIADARAEAFSIRTGRTVDEWWETRFATDEDFAAAAAAATAATATASTASPSVVLPQARSGGKSASKKSLERGTGTTESAVRSGEVEFMADGRAVIRAGAAYDVTTMVHELAHVFERDLKEEMPSLWNETLNVFGTKAADGTVTWDRNAQERFAATFEVYLQTGQAPTVKLVAVFRAFARWVTAIFKRFTSTDRMKLSPEMKKIYDSLLDANVDEISPSSEADAILAAAAADAGIPTPALIVVPPAPTPAAASTAPDPAASTAPDPATSTAPDPATSTAPDPATSTAPDPAASTAPDSAASTAPDPAASTAPDPATSTTPDPATSPSPAVTTEWRGIDFGSDTAVGAADALMKAAADGDEAVITSIISSGALSGDQVGMVLRESAIDRLEQEFGGDLPDSPDILYQNRFRAVIGAWIDDVAIGRRTVEEIREMLRRTGGREELADAVGAQAKILRDRMSQVMSKYTPMPDPSYKPTTLTGESGAPPQEGVRAWLESDEPDQMFAFKTSDGGFYKVYDDQFGRYRGYAKISGLVHRKWGGSSAGRAESFALATDQQIEQAILKVQKETSGRIFSIMVSSADNDYVVLTFLGTGSEGAFEKDVVVSTGGNAVQPGMRLLTMGDMTQSAMDPESWKKDFPSILESESISSSVSNQVPDNYPEYFGTFFFARPEPGLSAEGRMAFDANETKQIVEFARKTGNEPIVLAHESGDGYVVIRRIGSSSSAIQQGEGVFIQKPSQAKLKKLPVGWEVVIIGNKHGLVSMDGMQYYRKSDAIWDVIHAGPQNGYQFRVAIPERAAELSAFPSGEANRGLMQEVGVVYSLKQAARALVSGGERGEEVFLKWISQARQFHLFSLESFADDVVTANMDVFDYILKNGIKAVREIAADPETLAVNVSIGKSDISEMSARQLVFSLSMMFRDLEYTINSQTRSTLKEWKSDYENSESYQNYYRKTMGFEFEGEEGSSSTATGSSSSAEEAPAAPEPAASAEKSEPAPRAKRTRKKAEAKPKNEKRPDPVITEKEQARINALEELGQISAAVRDGTLSVQQGVERAAQVFDRAQALMGGVDDDVFRAQMDILRDAVDQDGGNPELGVVPPDEPAATQQSPFRDAEIADAIAAGLESFRNAVVYGANGEGAVFGENGAISIWDLPKRKDFSKKDYWYVLVDKDGEYVPGQVESEGVEARFVDASFFTDHVEASIKRLQSSVADLSPEMIRAGNFSSSGNSIDDARMLLNVVDQVRSPRRAHTEQSRILPSSQAKDIMVRRLAEQRGPAGFLFGIEANDRITRTAYVAQNPDGKWVTTLLLRDSSGSYVRYAFDDKYKAVLLAMQFGEGLDGFVNTTAAEMELRSRFQLDENSSSVLLTQDADVSDAVLIADLSRDDLARMDFGSGTYRLLPEVPNEPVPAPATQTAAEGPAATRVALPPLVQEPFDFIYSWTTDERLRTMAIQYLFYMVNLKRLDDRVRKAEELKPWKKPPQGASKERFDEWNERTKAFQKAKRKAESEREEFKKSFEFFARAANTALGDAYWRVVGNASEIAKDKESYDALVQWKNNNIPKVVSNFKINKNSSAPLYTEVNGWSVWQHDAAALYLLSFDGIKIIRESLKRLQEIKKEARRITTKEKWVVADEDKRAELRALTSSLGISIDWDADAIRSNVDRLIATFTVFEEKATKYNKKRISESGGLKTLIPSETEDLVNATRASFNSDLVSAMLTDIILYEARGDDRFRSFNTNLASNYIKVLGENEIASIRGAGERAVAREERYAKEDAGSTPAAEVAPAAPVPPAPSAAPKPETFKYHVDAIRVATRKMLEKGLHVEVLDADGNAMFIVPLERGSKTRGGAFKAQVKDSNGRVLNTGSDKEMLEFVLDKGGQVFGRVNALQATPATGVFYQQRKEAMWDSLDGPVGDRDFSIVFGLIESGFTPTAAQWKRQRQRLADSGTLTKEAVDFLDLVGGVDATDESIRAFVEKVAVAREMNSPEGRYFAKDDLSLLLFSDSLTQEQQQRYTEMNQRAAASLVDNAFADVGVTALETEQFRQMRERAARYGIRVDSTPGAISRLSGAIANTIGMTPRDLMSFSPLDLMKVAKELGDSGDVVGEAHFMALAYSAEKGALVNMTDAYAVSLVMSLLKNVESPNAMSVVGRARKFVALSSFGFPLDTDIGVFHDFLTAPQNADPSYAVYERERDRGAQGVAFLHSKEGISAEDAAALGDNDVVVLVNDVSSGFADYMMDAALPEVRSAVESLVEAGWTVSQQMYYSFPFSVPLTVVQKNPNTRVAWVPYSENVQSPEFIRWADGNALPSENGLPARMYLFRESDGAAWYEMAAGWKDVATSGFHSFPESAYVRMTNPLVVPWNAQTGAAVPFSVLGDMASQAEEMFGGALGMQEDFVALARQAGYDGVIFQNTLRYGGSADVYAAVDRSSVRPDWVEGELHVENSDRLFQERVEKVEQDSDAGLSVLRFLDPGPHERTVFERNTGVNDDGSPKKGWAAKKEPIPTAEADNAIAEGKAAFANVVVGDRVEWTYKKLSDYDRDRDTSPGTKPGALVTGKVLARTSVVWLDYGTDKGRVKKTALAITVLGDDGKLYYVTQDNAPKFFHDRAFVTFKDGRDLKFVKDRDGGALAVGDRIRVVKAGAEETFEVKERRDVDQFVLVDKDGKEVVMKAAEIAALNVDADNYFVISQAVYPAYPTLDEETPLDLPTAADAARMAEAEKYKTTDGVYSADVVDIDTAAKRKALEALKTGYLDHRRSWKPEEGEMVLTKEQRIALNALRLRLTEELSDTVSQAKGFAADMVNFTLLDYARKRGFDDMLWLMFPFSFWQTRQGYNFARRAIRNPQLIISYYRMREALEKEGRYQRNRQRLQSSIGVANALFWDPVSLLFPYAGFLDQQIDDPVDPQNWGQRVIDDLANVGLRPNMVIDTAMRYGNLLVEGEPGTETYDQQVAKYGSESIRNMIPISNAIQGLTALAGIGGPMGFNPESIARRGLGLSEMNQYEAYLVNRSIADTDAAGDVEAKRRGELWDAAPGAAATEWVSMHKNDLRTALRNATPESVAEELKVSPEFAAVVIDRVTSDAAKSAKEKAVTTVFGFLAGLRIKYQPEGEIVRQRLLDLEKSVSYNPLTGYGSLEMRNQVKEMFPSVLVRRSQYGALPGDSRDTAYIFDGIVREEINRQFDSLKQSMLMARPWDWKAVRTVEAGRTKALSFVRPRKDASKTVGDWKTEYDNTIKALAGVSVPEQVVMDKDYIPRSVVGANPMEVIEIRKNEIMYHLVQTRPTAEAFTDDSGDIDWAGYRRATEQWKSSLNVMAMSIPAVGRIVTAAKAEGAGDQVSRFVLNLNANDLDKYYRRNDDIYEAVQRAYREGLYEDALQAFADLKEAGDEEAWTKTVGSVGPIRARELAPYMRKFYGDKFSAAELDAVGNLEFPPAEEIRRYNMNASQAAKDKARTAFWDFYRRFTPPGSDAYELRNIPLISVALDQSSRSLLTEDQYNMATALAIQWVKERYGEDAMRNTPLVKEWEEARALREELDGALTARYGPQALRLLAAYDGSGTAAAKKELRSQYPMLDAMLLARRQFGLKFGVYAKYYRTAMKPFGSSRGGRSRPERPERPERPSNDY